MENQENHSNEDKQQHTTEGGKPTKGSDSSQIILDPASSPKTSKPAESPQQDHLDE